MEHISDWIVPAAIAGVVGIVVGFLIAIVGFPRRTGDGRPARVKRLKRGWWYKVVAITGPRTISVVDPEEGKEGEGNPISVKLSLLDTLRPVGRWVRLVKRKGQAVPMLEYSEVEPADASLPKIHTPSKVEV